MATLKGVIRTYGATVRKIEREQQRQARESAKRFKAQQKLEEIENAQQAVIDWVNYVDTLQAVHKNCTESIDWKQIENTKKPIEQKKENLNEIMAKNELSNFKPSFFEKIFGSKKKLEQLTENINFAKQKDEKDFNQRYKCFSEELINWEELQNISKGIKNRDDKQYRKALEYFNPFSDIGELGTKMTFNVSSNNFIDIDLLVNSTEIIPDYELKQTSTGKLSKKNMPKSRFNELHQDHICSASIRVAREVFAYLPIEFARINALSNILNPITGHLEEQPILSVIFVPKTIESLNLEAIDPSDSMQNFVHNMKFNKTKGFSIVEKVELNK